IETVCACSPPRSPSVWPEPTWIGVRPRRSGSAKFTRPSPPNVVPSRENRAWFWLIGNSCPLQSAQPFGANTKDITRISDRKGSAIWAISGSGLRAGCAADETAARDVAGGRTGGGGARVRVAGAHVVVDRHRVERAAGVTGQADVGR